MTVKDAFKIMRDIRETTLATVDDEGRPQARIIETMYADERSIYFVTARGKEVYEQLEKSHLAAMVGLSKDWISIRVSGMVEKLDDQHKWIDLCFVNNPSLEKIYPGHSRYILEVFRFVKGTVETFSVAQEPIERFVGTFGEHKLKLKGFYIHDECIECGLCLRNCPQNCIVAGTPYKIKQEHCLQCGLCEENCPVKTIERY
jgi:uncharacterized pyridoxamine 5'-phosphate oxidase family protein